MGIIKDEGIMELPDNWFFVDRLKRNLENANDDKSFCIKEKFYSYRDLRNLVSYVQDALPKNLVGARIAVIATDDILTYASLIAIWLKGGAYVPLGLHNPADRNIKILSDAECDIIISTILLDEAIYEKYNILKLGCPDRGYDSSKLELVPYNENSTAYILFTSGSTGVPKGVPISYKNVNAFVNAFEHTPIRIESDDKCLQMFELTFDVSISSFLVPLLNRACVYTVPNDGIKYLNVLKLIQRHQLTILQIVPSIIKLALPLLERLDFPSVKYCILTGEATQFDLYQRWIKCISQARVFNYYGPTEATIYCSYYECLSEQTQQYNGMIAIGHSFKNISLIICDEQLNQLDYGEKGELLISGDQLTNGYLNGNKKNYESFVTIGGNDNVRYYKSGDLCFKDVSGTIHYCGRLDNQVKIQGFRVELSEIEMNVRNQFKLNSVVLTLQGKSDATELHLVIESCNENIKAGILHFLKEKLPDYMIPAKITIMDQFPLNSSGKTDKVAIKGILYGN